MTGPLLSLQPEDLPPGCSIDSCSRIAHIVSVFPSLTETFVLYDIVAMEKLGMDIRLYSLQRGKPGVMHPEAAAMLPQVKFHPLLSWRILRAHAAFIRRAPRAYWSALWTWIRSTWGSLRYFAGVLAFFPKAVFFARTMQEEGITHIHAHFASHPAAAAFVIHRLTGIPYSFAAHGSDIHRELRMLREKVSEAAFVSTCAEFNKDWIATECGQSCRDKIFVIHNGVDTSAFYPRKSDGSSNATTTILCIGTLYEVKGQKYLLQACALLRDRGVSFKCNFVGDGADFRMLLRTTKELKLEDSVCFHGFLERAKVAALLRQADVLVCPSILSRDGRREGMPTVLVEAMAAGVPVVASRLSGIPELVEHEKTGLLFPPGDSQSLADALNRLIVESEFGRSLAAAAHEKVLSEYDRTKNCLRLVQCISKVSH